MTTTTRVISYADGSLVSPGEYNLVGTTVHVTSVQRSNGLSIDRQDVTITHTVAPRTNGAPVESDADEPAPAASETERDDAPEARCVHCADFPAKHGERTLACLRAGFYGNRYAPMTEAEDQQYVRDALAEIRTAFDACFTPDFKGVDWKDDAAIQALAAKVYPILYRTTDQHQESAS